MSSVGFFSFLRNRYRECAGQVFSGNRGGIFAYLGKGSLRHDLSSGRARARPHVNDKISGPRGGLVVLHYYDGIAEVAEFFERVEKAPVIPLMKPDRGLVEHVEDSGKPASYLGREAYPLPLAAREGLGFSLEGQVVEPHVREKGQPLPYLFYYPSRYFFFYGVEFEILEKFNGLFYGHSDDVVYGFFADLYVKGFFFQARAFAERAGLRVHVALKLR